MLAQTVGGLEEAQDLRNSESTEAVIASGIVSFWVFLPWTPGPEHTHRATGTQIYARTAALHFLCCCQKYGPIPNYFLDNL